MPDDPGCDPVQLHAVPAGEEFSGGSAIIFGACQRGRYGLRRTRHRFGDQGRFGGVVISSRRAETAARPRREEITTRTRACEDKNGRHGPCADPDKVFATQPQVSADMTARCRSVGAPVPILRVQRFEDARYFYLDYLGFVTEREHRFEPGMPLYTRVVCGDTRLDLSEHHGDGTPGASVWIPVAEVRALHKELERKKYLSMRPGVEDDAPGGPTLSVIDPFGSSLRFCQRACSGPESSARRPRPGHLLQLGRGQDE